MQRYTKTLVEEETNLSIMVEKALRDIEKEDEANAENTEDMIIDDIDLSLEDLEKTLKDQDYVDFQEFLDEEAEADSDYLTRGRN
jgi:molybdopterin converting factor small subunit